MSRHASAALIPVEETEQPPRRRRRAPRRAGGHRAQLTVPEEMWREVTGIARTAGTTPNDALVRLAAERLQERRRTLALQRRAEERWEAFAGAAGSADAPAAPLSEEELVEFSKAFREDG